ncbi:transporter [Phormidesmis priestleyi ULC007]|uniref:Transporter n=1 Tax=Phormidesmis priestleyi ULC007 TaxID=1920490 RepID=A0A2T1DAV8_9CYAN|nr:cadmium resistance transporter [Phormidesmis priestleyi]PSB17628.1 transporter [Phormidesmis priestleyi ULC007]PZO48505.1 MAG: transporter [Phormidesmis priestleyi]
MSGFISALLAGVTAFIATNLDDIVILMLFFAQTNAAFHPKHIVAGQYLGFGALILASLPGFFGGLMVPKTWIGLLGLLPIAIGLYHLIHREADDQVQTISNDFKESKIKLPILSALGLLAPQTYQVAAVTIANGGDNIGIYVPLFATSNAASLGVILSIFFVMVGVWCYVAYQLARHPIVARVLTRYGSAIVPFVLIGLGIFILVDSGTYKLLTTP